LVLQNAAGGKVQIAVDIEDKCNAAAIVRITADEVGLEVTCSMQKPQDFMDEVRRLLLESLGLQTLERSWQLLRSRVDFLSIDAWHTQVREYLGKCLRVRLGDIKIERGWSARSRLLLVEGISPEQVNRLCCVHCVWSRSIPC
jgi:hypothetical protein